jgi:hypothetical protein
MVDVRHLDGFDTKSKFASPGKGTKASSVAFGHQFREKAAVLTVLCGDRGNRTSIGLLSAPGALGNRGRKVSNE